MHAWLTRADVALNWMRNTVSANLALRLNEMGMVKMWLKVSMGLGKRGWGWQLKVYGTCLRAACRSVCRSASFVLHVHMFV